MCLLLLLVLYVVMLFNARGCTFFCVEPMDAVYKPHTLFWVGWRLWHVMPPFICIQGVPAICILRTCTRVDLCLEHYKCALRILSIRKHSPCLEQLLNLCIGLAGRVLQWTGVCAVGAAGVTGVLGTPVALQSCGPHLSALCQCVGPC
jgi:hypothetical protein